MNSCDIFVSRITWILAKMQGAGLVSWCLFSMVHGNVHRQFGHAPDVGYVTFFMYITYAIYVLSFSNNIIYFFKMAALVDGP